MTSLKFQSFEDSFFSELSLTEIYLTFYSDEAQDNKENLF